ncbi:MAG TPA: ATP-binding protein [Ktedonobacterales bacterium]
MTEPADRPVGITKGPGETIHEYTFISRDEQRLLKNGEYVYYELDAAPMGDLSPSPSPARGGGPEKPIPARGGGPDIPRRVLGRIMRRVPVQLYPDTFLSEPEVAPSQVAALVGYDARTNDLFELHVAIMGYYDPRLATFVNPWIPPQSGTPIFLASDDLLASVVSQKRAGAQGSAAIGSLLTRPEGAVPIVLDVNELVSTHLAIIASTGAGKSYLASVIIEELMRPNNRAAVLIVDPHGEYGTLQELPNFEEFAETDDAQNARRPRSRYRPQVQVKLHDQVKVRLSTLDLGDLRHLLPDMTEKQHYLLGRAYNAMKRDKSRLHWSADDLKRAVKAVAHEQNDDMGDENVGSTVAALNWKIDTRFNENSFVFHPTQQLGLAEIFKPGQCTVLQLDEVDDRDQQVIVATLLRRVYHARMETERGKTQPGDEAHLPYPVFVLIEEAHHFAPHGQEVVSSRQLRTVLSEGRKFGIGVGLITQRPGKLDPDVLSQCLTQCIMRIVNDVDQKSVATAVEGVGHDLLDNLPALSKGQAVIAGSAVNTPVICRVRSRVTPHGGESKDATAEWLRQFDGEVVAARTRDSAPIARDDKGFSMFR